MYYGYITYGALVASAIFISSAISILFGIFLDVVEEQDR
jgi:hypothetical protein